MQVKHLLTFTVITLSLGFSTLLAKDNIYANVPSSLIQPTDGRWKASVKSNDTKGCPIMMKSMLSKESLPSKSKAMVFNTPFDPSTLFDKSKDLKWESVGINKWKAVMIQAKGAVNMSITWKLAINAKNKMAVHSLIKIDLPKELTAMLGGSGQCTVNTLGDFNLIK
ncbi:hypothetical protein MNB_SV-13-1103 [hydrothermal vent metagenome]|uniref:Uncharacterized protein n=1 Tax=hydrothermal vent metagenome TaxID=652676 RepID=A0A1W1CKV0_9ZZZZ